MTRRAPDTQLSFFETAACALQPDDLAGTVAKRRASPVPSYLKDHRKRLRTRFRDSGADAVPDYELLELLLFRSFRNGDVKPVARRLIDRFGGLQEVLAASIDRLCDVDGIGPESALDLKLIEAATQRRAHSKLLKRNVISNWSALLDYCHVSMANRDTEQFRIFFLDRKNVLIADELQAKGTVDHVPVYPREIVKRALDLNASALILVHNHPSGDPTPSQADISLTQTIVAACDSVGITVHDHLIIGKNSETSFKSAGYL